MAKSERIAIVVAWVVEDVVSIGPDRGADLGRRREVKTGPVARAAMWLNSGTPGDVAAAEAYTRTVDSHDRPAQVYVYPTSERDPLGRARQAIMAGRPQP